MVFDAFDFDTIMQRMLSNVPDNLDKREGSLIYDALASAAAELELAYVMMDYILIQAFADTADRDYLILRAKERGLEPYPATNAILKGEFTPVDADVTGKRFNLGDLNYVVGDPLNELGAYQLVCETAGIVGHQNLGTLIPIELVEGLETATATEVLIPGEDEEDTEEFRQRYKDSFGEKPFGGNVADYKNKINAIAGVGGTRVIPVWNGGMTVKCLIINSEYSKASDALIHSVQEEIDPDQDGKGLGIAPIGHVVTIDTPDETTVNVNCVITFDTGYSYENMDPVIKETIENYLLELRTDWKNHIAGQSTTVRISQIETRILALAGVLDIENTKINDVAANLTITDDDIPIMGVLTHADS